MSVVSVCICFEMKNDEFSLQLPFSSNENMNVAAHYKLTRVLESTLGRDLWSTYIGALCFNVTSVFELKALI